MLVDSFVEMLTGLLTPELTFDAAAKANIRHGLASVPGKSATEVIRSPHALLRLFSANVTAHGEFFTNALLEAQRHALEAHDRSSLGPVLGRASGSQHGAAGEPATSGVMLFSRTPARPAIISATWPTRTGPHDPRSSLSHSAPTISVDTRDAARGAQDGGREEMLGGGNSLSPPLVAGDKIEGKDAPRSAMKYWYDNDGNQVLMTEGSGAMDRVAMLHHWLRIASPERRFTLFGQNLRYTPESFAVAFNHQRQLYVGSVLGTPQGWSTFGIYDKVRDLAVFKDAKLFEAFVLFDCDPIRPWKFSLAHFLPMGQAFEFWAKRNEASVWQVFQRAVHNFAHAFLVVYGTDCYNAVQALLDFLDDSTRLRGIGIAYVFFTVNRAVMLTMYKFKHERCTEPAWPLFGHGAFDRHLTRALADAIAAVPRPGESMSAVNLFLHEDYHEVQWKRPETKKTEPKDTKRRSRSPSDATDEDTQPKVLSKSARKRQAKARKAATRLEAAASGAVAGVTGTTATTQPQNARGASDTPGRTDPPAAAEKTPCPFHLAGLLQLKDRDGAIRKCRFSGAECKYRHVGALSELTKAQVSAALQGSFTGAANKAAADEAMEAAPAGTFKTT
jgi:hypothetical protein